MRRLVLRTIYDEGPMSRADVARATTLTRPTVSDLVSELLALSLIEETGRGVSSRGQAPVLLRFVDDARLIVAVDVAETELRGALVDLRGDVRRHIVRPTLEVDDGRFLRELDSLLDELAEAADRRLLGIGIAVPGSVDPVRGVVERAVHLDWRDLPLGQRLELRHGVPTHVLNDSQASALAVHMFGRRLPDANLLVIHAGRGVGAGLIIGGQLFSGHAGGAGEIGHTTVVGAAEGLACICGRVGCLETIAGSEGLLRRVRADARSRASAALAVYAEAPERLGLDELRRLVERGDGLAAAHVRTSGQALGSAVAMLIGALDVERIVIVGSMTTLGEHWMGPLREAALRDALPALSSRSRIEAADLDPDQVLRGAAAMLVSRELGLGRWIAGEGGDRM